MEMERVQAVLDAAHAVGAESLAISGWRKWLRARLGLALPSEAVLIEAINRMKRGSPVYCGLRRRDNRSR